MSDEVRLKLQNPEGTGKPRFEMVHVAHLGGARYRVLSAPFFVEEISSGDEIEVVADGLFRVLRRGGNVTIQFFRGPVHVSSAIERLVARLSEHGGRIEGDSPFMAVLAVPLWRMGFPRIEAAMREAEGAEPGSSWMYGNIYHPETGAPLDWWVEEH